MPRPLGLRGAIGLMLLVIVVQVAGGIVLAMVHVLLHQMKIPMDQNTGMAIGILAVQFVSFVPAIAVGLSMARRPASEVLPFARFRPWALLPLLAAMGGVVILVSEADNLLRAVHPVPKTLSEPFQQLSGAGWLGFAALVIMAPLTEELLYRGVILTGFLRRYGVGRAVVYAAVLFALSHLNPYQLPAGLAMGLLLGWVLLRTGSLWPCLLLHAAFNAAVFGLPWIHDHLFQIRGFTASAAPELVEFQPAWFDALGVLLVCLGMAVSARLIGPGPNRHDCPDNDPGTTA